MATTNFSWTLPTEGGDAGVWDTTLNAAFDSVDSDLFIVKTTADAAMPKAGGTFTGETTVHSIPATTVNAGNMTGSVTLDLDNGEAFYGTMTGAVTTFAISNWTASQTQTVTLEITNGGSAAWTWPAAIVWDGDTDPTFQSSGVDIVILSSRDGGTTIRGMHSYSATS
jgi:hypothetical protein